MKTYLLILSLFACCLAEAQIPDHIFKPNIQAVKLFRGSENVYEYPILNLNGGEALQLFFDDLDADIKNYYYSFQLCNADWTPANIQTFDYIRGFQSTRISTYRHSSISLTRYTHYEATVPDRGTTIIRSGNYLLKVFRNNDTSDLFFTRRFLVVDNKVQIAAQIKQPFNPQYYLTDQRVMVGVNTASARINVFSPQDIKLVVMQNFSWPSSALVDKPTLYRGTYFEYNEDNLSFPSGREWRWIDLRTLRLLTDRMADIVDTSNRVDVFVKPDVERRNQIYFFYRDINGKFTIENADGNNPRWQSDYAWVHFTFIPPNNQAYGGKDLYLYGELTNFTADDYSRMEFNREKGVYEKTLFLKQGFYNYSYISLNINQPVSSRVSFDPAEGNFTNTENNYTILVYYRAYGGRADELIGFSTLNSLVSQ